VGRIKHGYRHGYLISMETQKKKNRYEFGQESFRTRNVFESKKGREDLDLIYFISALQRKMLNTRVEFGIGLSRHQKI
jgi:hypothetical protein